MNGKTTGVELLVQEALEFLAELVQRAMDFAPIEVESQPAGRDENPENPPVGNAVEVAVPPFVNQPLLQCGVFERVSGRLFRDPRCAAGLAGMPVAGRAECNGKGDERAGGNLSTFAVITHRED
jgi:hypothetical protein